VVRLALIKDPGTKYEPEKINWLGRSSFVQILPQTDS